MNVLDLFSGIGGFSLGLERAGMRTVAFCEIDPYCRAVLRKHWPDVPVFGDVREFTAEAVADTFGHALWDQSGRGNGASGADPAVIADDGAQRIDVICGGFPCQDISVAGKGAGIGGERSGLWSEYARIIGEVRPRYVIVENVAALLGRGLERVLGDLAALGFDAEWHCIPASAVGAPHRRDRVWIIAYPSGGQQPEQSQSNGKSLAGIGASLRRDIERCSLALAGGEGLALGARPFGQWAYTASTGNSWWATEPDVGRSPDGFPPWLERCVGRGLSYAESGRRTKILRGLWTDHVSQALRRTIGGFDRIQQAEVLFAFVREYENGTDQARLLVAGKEAPETFLRGLRQRAEARSASHRSGHNEQRSDEHSDAMQSLPRLLAHDSEARWAGSGWEDAVPRVANGVAKRVDRLRALGNAIVPQIAEIIGRAIMSVQRDGYNATDDFARSIDEAYRAIRERMANGGPGWTQKPWPSGQ